MGGKGGMAAATIFLNSSALFPENISLWYNIAGLS